MVSTRSVVWIRRGDMRTVDHAGLTAAAMAEATAVVSVVRQDSNLEVLAALSRAIEARGTSLFLTRAKNEALAVAEFAREFGATSIHIRKDDTEESQSVLRELMQYIPDGVAVETWTDSFRKWDESKLAQIPYEYPAFMNWGERRRSPLLPSGADRTLRYLPPTSELSCLNADEFLSGIELSKFNNPSPAYQNFQQRYQADSKLAKTIVVEPGPLDADAFGERLVKEFLEAADAYKYPDMGRTLAPVFEEGLLSSRRIHEIIIEHERLNGRIFRPIYREGAKRLLDYLDSREFSQLLARQDIEKSATVDGVHRAKFWRWRGFLIRYVDEGPEDNSDEGKPPLVLVHGFGASSQHFGRSLAILKKKFRVYALDILGYGRSEKVPTAYTPDLTECVIWEFVRDIVRAPVYIAGNSIGGYFSASFASDAYPELCAGVVLINSAGKIETPEAEAVENRRSNNPLNALFSLGKFVLQEWKTARMFASNVLLRNLRTSIRKTLKTVYPTNPDAADEQLATEIYRNSLDFGADEVLASGIVLPSPRTLTELLAKYSGPALIYQGVLDPLNGSGDRAWKIQGAYPEATVAARELG